MRWAALGVLALLASAGVAVVVAWPALKAWWNPVPPDPVESVATAYLQAIADGNTEAVQKLGTVDLPPAIRSFRKVKHEKARDTRLKGSFAPIAAFHANVDEKFTFNPETGRYETKNPLGPAAETLDALHEAKDKMEKDGLNKKIASGDPDDLFDAAEGLAKTFSNISETLHPKKIIPTYKQLVEEAKPPLPRAERELALDYASKRETWDALLKRPFPTLKADGPFLLDRAEVTTSALDKLGSAGDPPTTLNLTLTRFRLEGIDTGWRVTKARRAGQPEEPAEAPPQEEAPPAEKTKPFRSPGEAVKSPGESAADLLAPGSPTGTTP
jgi:hypothetical protein